MNKGTELFEVVGEFLELASSFKKNAKSTEFFFYSHEIPPIAIKDYVKRLVSWCPCTKQCFVYAIEYIQRILLAHPEIKLNSNNIHRIYFTAVLISSKFCDDLYYNNKAWGKVGGLEIQEVNALEIEFIFLIDFSLNVNIVDYNRTLTAIHNLDTNFLNPHFIGSSDSNLSYSEDKSFSDEEYTEINFSMDKNEISNNSSTSLANSYNNRNTGCLSDSSDYSSDLSNSEDIQIESPNSQYSEGISYNHSQQQNENGNNNQTLFQNQKALFQNQFNVFTNEIHLDQIVQFHQQQIYTQQLLKLQQLQQELQYNQKPQQKQPQENIRSVMNENGNGNEDRNENENENENENGNGKNNQEKISFNDFAWPSSEETESDNETNGDFSNSSDLIPEFNESSSDQSEESNDNSNSNTNSNSNSTQYQYFGENENENVNENANRNVNINENQFQNQNENLDVNVNENENVNHFQNQLGFNPNLQQEFSNFYNNGNNQNITIDPNLYRSQQQQLHQQQLQQQHLQQFYHLQQLHKYQQQQLLHQQQQQQTQQQTFTNLNQFRKLNSNPNTSTFYSDLQFNNNNGFNNETEQKD
ncbi:cyclin-related 2 family protein [Anaeramoeba flamelloides]|uniref:Cyclin-related 2 family protein n=1 Tax=Anaeramoeba flamelloides TaxID=1746091 RepID=A0AAV7Z7Z6_9EUKA|nr:cyclin-related 2 family protein [Anaeramoeba flamelloides]